VASAISTAVITAATAATTITDFTETEGGAKDKECGGSFAQIAPAKSPLSTSPPMWAKV
jgi:hypothetical protein